jgi:hypothetical protein
MPVEKAASATKLEDQTPVSSEAVPLDLVQDVVEPDVTSAPAAPKVPAESVAPSAPTSDPAVSMDRSAEDTVPLPETWVDSSALELEPLDSASLSESATSSLPSAAPATLPSPSTAALPTPLPTEVPPVAAVPASAASESKQVAHEDETPMLELAEPHEKWADLMQATQQPKPESAPEKQAAQSEPEAKSHEPLAKPEPAFHQEPEAAPKEPEAAPKTEFAVDWPPAFVPAVSAVVNEARASALEILPAAITASEASKPESDASPLATASLLPGAASPSPEAMEAAIQRVMERMKPQIMELVSRDILRPLVEALVQQELKK